MTRSSGRWTSAAANSAAIALVVMTVACGTSAPAGPVTHERHTIGRGAATRARVEIDMSAGELVVKSGATKLLEGDYDFNVPALKPMIAYAVNGNAGTLKLSQGSASGNYENTWHLSLDETIPIDLAVSVTAGDAELVLGRVNLQNVSIRLGAGDLVVDLRGTPARSYTVKVQAGAGDTTIRLPAGVGISAGTSGLIGDSNVSGLEQRDGKWINPRAQGSPVVVDVTVQHAIGDLTLIAE